MRWGHLRKLRRMLVIDAKLVASERVEMFELFFARVACSDRLSDQAQCLLERIRKERIDGAGFSVAARSNEFRNRLSGR